jgi:hypothetical protein
MKRQSLRQCAIDDGGILLALRCAHMADANPGQVFDERLRRCRCG